MAFDVVSTQALKEFRELGAQYVKDFEEIKRDFERYNREFLAQYAGLGADKYKTVSDLITENVTDFEDMYKTICKELIDPLLECFQDMDEYLDEQNQDMIPKDDEEESGRKGC